MPRDHLLGEIWKIYSTRSPKIASSDACVSLSRQPSGRSACGLAWHVMPKSQRTSPKVTCDRGEQETCSKHDGSARHRMRTFMPESSADPRSQQKYATALVPMTAEQCAAPSVEPALAAPLRSADFEEGIPWPYRQGCVRGASSDGGRLT